MRRTQLRRDENAVSAAVATVLLLGGVLSIIGLMMVSMMPVIEEMEGSVERHDMASQMSLLAHDTSELRAWHARRFDPRNADPRGWEFGVGPLARGNVVFCNMGRGHIAAGQGCFGF